MVSIIQKRKWDKNHFLLFCKKLHDYYLVTLSESLIFLGFSMLLAFDLMGVIWREKKSSKIGTF